MRARRALLAFVLLAAGCGTVGGERVHVGIWNDDARQHTIRIDVDGQPFFSGIAAMTRSEPSIVSSIESRLNPGRHHVEVTSDNGTRSMEFEVDAARAATFTST